MAGHRRRDLLASRRRRDDDGEEEGSVGADVEDDSMSEGSLFSDGDHEEEDEDEEERSSTQPVDRSDGAVQDSRTSQPSGSLANGHSQTVDAKDPLGDIAASNDKQPSKNVEITDTEAMMNGLQISEHAGPGEALEFDEIKEGEDVTSVPAAELTEEALKHETSAERRRREHEEYRKKRDADPTFIPNRGGFFMHDHRSAGPGQNGFRPFGRGRGRGKGAIGGPFSPANQIPQASEATDSPWTHDLHDTVTQSSINPALQGASNNIARSDELSKPPSTAPRTSPLNRSFSKTVHIGNVQIRVYLSGMKDPITFSAVPVKQHTRLPQHRPPLRRDKPVRISLPEQPPRYIFPAMDRSFIFIPRALRPNQQGYGRGRPRPGFGQYSGFASRRTSVYGGSVYSPSVAMSRRSSLAREISRDSIISPTGSTVSRSALIPVQPGKAVVKLPPSGPASQPSFDPSHGHPVHVNGVQPVVNLPGRQAYPAPDTPTYRENRAGPLPMHQPRPQKTVSVADIESPDSVPFQPPQQQQEQPFHHQVPTQVNGHNFAPEPSTYPHSRHPSFPSQASAGTPLSHIPERAIHAQPFQPHIYSAPAYPGQAFPQPLPPQGSFYYPPYAGNMAPSTAAAPAFVPNQQQQTPFVVPAAGSVAGNNAQPGTVAHESNGMVYYYDSAQVYAPPGGAAAYPASGYVVPPAGGVVGMGGMITPSPDVYYYPQPVQGDVYYPQ